MKTPSCFQQMLLDDLVPGIWYDVHLEQGSGGETMPDWFYRQQSQPLSTLQPMIDAGLLILRRDDLGLPQIYKPVLVELE